METRIRRNIIILVVVTFLALIGMSAGWFFVLVRPQKEEIAKADTEYTTLKGKAGKLKGALDEERKAKDKLEYLKGQLTFFRGSEVSEGTGGLYRRLYFGAIDGTTELNTAARQATWRQWMNEYHYAYGPTLRFELNRIARAAGVKLETSVIKVDDPPQKPEDVKAPNNGLLKPLSATNGGVVNVTITTDPNTGSFGNILRFLELVNHSEILMVVGNIKLEGYSPQLKATFPLTPYLIAAGPGIKLTAASALPGGGSTPPGEGTPSPDGTSPTTPPTSPTTSAPATNAGSAGSNVKIKNPRLGA